MKLEDFFNCLLPGDENLNVPCFEFCDDAEIINDFLCSFPQSIIDVINKLGCDEKGPKELIAEIRKGGLDAGLLVNSLLDFYFSRPSVVIPLTGRIVPLSSSGMAIF